jgi:hypothetical protein
MSGAVSAPVRAPDHAVARWAASAIARMRRAPRPLVAQLLAATALSVAWAVVTAPLDGPDEIGHAAYVQHLAETGDGPRGSDPAHPGRGVSSEAEALLFWANLEALARNDETRPAWSAAEQDAYRRAARGAARDDGAGPNPLAQNPPLYYAYETVPYAVGTGWSLPARLLLMRLANLPLLWIVVGFSWLIMGEVFGRRRFLQTVGTGAVALLPMVTFLSGVINPEIALTAVTTAAIALSLAALRLGPRLPVVLGLCGLGGAAVLIHARGLALLPAIAIVLALVVWRTRHEPGGRRRLLVTGGAVLVMGAALAVALAYSGGHASVGAFGGELTGSSSSGLDDLSGLASYVWQFYFSPLTGMAPPPGDGVPGYRQIFVLQFLGGQFGSLEVVYADIVYSALQVAQALGLIALFALVVRHADRLRRHGAQIVVLLAFLGSMLVLLHVAAWQDLSSPAHASLLAGRYLVCLVAIFGVAVTAVVALVPRRVGVALGAVVLGSGAVLGVGGIFVSLVRFYA